MCVGGGGLKTETGKFHEILAVFFLLHEHLQRKLTFFYTPLKTFSVCVGGLKSFFIPPKIFSVCVGSGLKTETGKFLLHFQNSKSSNRCRSVYGTDIKSPGMENYVRILRIMYTLSVYIGDNEDSFCMMLYITKHQMQSSLVHNIGDLKYL